MAKISPLIAMLLLSWFTNRQGPEKFLITYTALPPLELIPNCNDSDYWCPLMGDLVWQRQLRQLISILVSGIKPRF
jgi:hypothetical protein